MLVDGTKPIGELLAAVVRLGGAAEVLESLVREGFIAPIDVAATAPAPAPSSGAPAAPALAADDPAKVGAAKMAMRSYIKLAAGMLEGRSLNKLVDRVHSTDEVLRCLAELRTRLAGGNRAEALANIEAELGEILHR